jgi:hypothetical protein
VSTYSGPTAPSLWQGIVGLGYTAEDLEKYLSNLTLQTWKPEFVVLHNTFDPTIASWHDVTGLSRMRGFERYYQTPEAQGGPAGGPWHAGPHFFVADDLVWVFSSPLAPGVHSPSWNAVSWGVELVGDYDKETLSDASRDNLVTLLAGLHRLGSIDPMGLRFHREDPLTSHKHCPGAGIVKADVISWVDQRMGLQTQP